ncbi:YceI family protein [Haliscomenobacter hydrossis]|nr:YceI family protein [Haliscomenobacter hydrossis]
MIHPSSQLSLFGSSNINKFQCDCTDEFPRSTLKFNRGKNGTSATFSNAILNIRAGALDCGNKIMNKDLYKTLKGDEYPEIQIELLQVKQLNESKPGAWSNQLVEAALTIAGVRKTIELSVRAQQTDPDRFRFVSDKNILMTEFGLIPPKALMGTIKVNDLIRIHMDMIVGVERGM